MNEELQFNHMESYELAEQKAAHYFNIPFCTSTTKDPLFLLLQKILTPGNSIIFIIIHSCPFFHEKRKNLIQRDITVISNGWIIQAN